MHNFMQIRISCTWNAAHSVHLHTAQSRSLTASGTGSFVIIEIVAKFMKS